MVYPAPLKALLGERFNSEAGKGDLFSVVNKEGRIVGRAELLKLNGQKAVLNFAGTAQKGYKILLQDYTPSNTSQNNDDEQSPAGLSQDNMVYNKHKNLTDISTGQYVVGGILGTLIGLGAGHAVQERYTENGWLFTVSQLSGAFAWNIFATQGNEIWATLSAISLIGFRIWELIDVWSLPSSHKIAWREEENSFYIAPFLYSYNNSSHNDSSQKILGLSFGFKW